MTLDEAKALLARISYRNFEFNVYASPKPWGGSNIHITAIGEAPNTYRPNSMTSIGAPVEIPAEMFASLVMTPQLLVMFVWQAIDAVEMHERQEHFYLDGKLHFDPHARGENPNRHSPNFMKTPVPIPDVPSTPIDDLEWIVTPGKSE